MTSSLLWQAQRRKSNASWPSLTQRTVFYIATQAWQSRSAEKVKFEGGGIGPVKLACMVLSDDGSSVENLHVPTMWWMCCLQYMQKFLLSPLENTMLHALPPDDITMHSWLTSIASNLGIPRSSLCPLFAHAVTFWEFQLLSSHGNSSYCHLRYMYVTAS